MAAVCDICGKKPFFGKAVTFSHKRNNRRWNPNVQRVRALPGVIVQGRYDMVCPIATADELYQAWPEAQYVVVPNAGHSAWEPGIRAALVSNGIAGVYADALGDVSPPHDP